MSKQLSADGKPGKTEFTMQKNGETNSMRLVIPRNGIFKVGDKVKILEHGNSLELVRPEDE